MEQNTFIDLYVRLIIDIASRETSKGKTWQSRLAKRDAAYLGLDKALLVDDSRRRRASVAILHASNGRPLGFFRAYIH